MVDLKYFLPENLEAALLVFNSNDAIPLTGGRHYCRK